MLPICMKPYQDELLFGWMLRLMKANGIKTIGRFKNLLFSGKSDGAVRKEAEGCRLDYIRGLDRICRENAELHSFPDIRFILKNMTGVWAAAPLMNYGKQAMQAQYILKDRDDSLYDMRPNGDFTELRFCPDCMAEDIARYGEPYFHTWHHLPGTYVCAVHGKVLMSPQDRDVNSIKLDQVFDNGVPLQFHGNLKLAEKNAKLSMRLYADPVYIDLNETFSILRDRALSKAGAGASVGMNRHCTKEQALSVIAYLFETAEEFAIQAKKREWSFLSEWQQKIDETFDCLSLKEGIAELKCRTCGTSFFIHPYAIMLGCGCPECDRKLDRNALINRQLQNIGDGRNVLLSRFQSYADPHAKILHTKCGQIRETKLFNAIWQENGCRCLLKNDYMTAKERIEEKWQDYLVTGYRREGDVLYLNVLHRNCGKQFETPYKYFLQYPNCKYCSFHSYTEKSFAERVRELGLGEYELMTPYAGINEKITILHKACGTLTEMSARKFLKGQRCALCTPFIRVEEMKSLIREYAGKEYQVERNGRNRYDITAANGKKHSVEATYIVQELAKSSSSELFPKKEKSLIPPVSASGVFYRKAYQIFGEHSPFKVSDIASGQAAYTSVKTLEKRGYLIKTGSGQYRINPEKRAGDRR